MKITGFRSPWAALAISVFLYGCGTSLSTGGPTAEQRRAIEAQKASIVLLRVTATRDGKVMDITGSRDEPWHCLQVRAVELGATATGAPPGTENKVPTSELRKVGWRFLVLPPGSYRLLISSPLTACDWLHTYLNSWWRTRDGSNRAPSFWLNVPRGQSFLYAGSVHITCSSAARACSGDLDVVDETDLAKEIAHAHFSEYGPLTTSRMGHYGDPIDLAKLRETQPLTLVTTGAEELVTPDWGQYSKKFFAPSAWALDAMDGTGSTEGGLVALMFAIAYLPVGAALAAADAELAERKWAPCLQGLVQEIQEFDPMADLRRHVNENLREQGFDPVSELGSAVNAVSLAADAGAKGVLQADIQRIQLRDCGAGGGKTFCLEVAVRARLIDIDTGEPLYDTAFVYSNEYLRVFDLDGSPGVYDFPSREFAVGKSECRELTAYCNGNGRDLLRADLARALDTLARNIVTKVPWEDHQVAPDLEDTQGDVLKNLDQLSALGTGSQPESDVEGEADAKAALLAKLSNEESEFDVEEVLKDPNLKQKIMAYYNEGSFRKISKAWGQQRLATRMESIDQLKALNVSGNIVRVQVEYRWRFDEVGYGGGRGSDLGIATIGKIGSTYEVLDFE